MCSPLILRRKVATTIWMRRANRLCARALRIAPKGQNQWVTEALPGSRDHVSAGRSLCRFSFERLHDRDDRCEHRFVCPASRKGRASRTGGPTCGTPGHGPSCASARHGSPGATSGHGAARRTGVPSSSAAAAPGHGAASDAAHRCTAAPGRAENRRTLAPERTALSERAPIATGADRPARAAHPAAAANQAGAAARCAFAPECAAPGPHRSVAAAVAADRTTPASARAACAAAPANRAGTAA